MMVALASLREYPGSLEPFDVTGVDRAKLTELGEFHRTYCFDSGAPVSHPSLNTGLALVCHIGLTASLGYTVVCNKWDTMNDMFTLYLMLCILCARYGQKVTINWYVARATALNA